MRARLVRWYQCPACEKTTRTEIALTKDTTRYIILVCAHCDVAIPTIKQQADYAHPIPYPECVTQQGGCEMHPYVL